MSTISKSKSPSRVAAIPNRSTQTYTNQQNVHNSAFCKRKRLIDLLGAILGLAVTAVVIIPIAIAIKIDNPGPIFYSQIRCGLRGKPFRIWKFRSMIVKADCFKHLVNNQASGNIFKNDNDPRVTRVGRFLRRTSLDELPQFWNVLKGEMSLVGTRPPLLDEVIGYEQHHWQRLNIKPGITGEWQANGRSCITDFEAIVQMDLDYQRKWSVTYDLMLILKTLKIVANNEGAC